MKQRREAALREPPKPKPGVARGPRGQAISMKVTLTALSFALLDALRSFCFASTWVRQGAAAYGRGWQIYAEQCPVLPSTM